MRKLLSLLLCAVLLSGCGAAETVPADEGQSGGEVDSLPLTEVRKDQLSEDAAIHLQNEIDAEIEHEFKRFYSLANRATSFTRNADGSLATATSENEDEDVTCVSTFNRNTDGSISSVVTVVTPYAGNFYYTQTATFTRNADGSLLSVAEAYTSTPKS